MANCHSCGKPLLEGSHFCPECGAITNDSPNQNVDPRLLPPAKVSRYAVLSSWSFLGTMLLMCIPVVGLILMIVWALGGAHNLNRVHFARAVLMLMLIGILILVGLWLALGFYPFVSYEMFLFH